MDVSSKYGLIPSWIPHARTRESHPWNPPDFPVASSHCDGTRPAALFLYVSSRACRMAVPLFFLSPAIRQQIADVPFSRSYTISLYSTIRAARTLFLSLSFSLLLSLDSCDIETTFVNTSKILII